MTTTSTVKYNKIATQDGFAIVKLEKISCPVCGKKINRDAYPFHMRAAHAEEVE